MYYVLTFSAHPIPIESFIAVFQKEMEAYAYACDVLVLNNIATFKKKRLILGEASEPQMKRMFEWLCNTNKPKEAFALYMSFCEKYRVKPEVVIKEED